MEKAAFHGHGGACNNLGYLYDHGGVTITKDPNQARRYYKAGAMKGIPSPSLPFTFNHESN
jgi:TPR repeat protein